jgi:hypothetical protein
MLAFFVLARIGGSLYSPEVGKGNDTMSEETKTETPPEKRLKLLDPKANLRSLVRILAIAFILGAGVWLLIRFTAGEKAANRVTSAVLQRPIELKNSVENMPASSWKGFPLSLPYTGTLTIAATVVKGNELDVYVVEENQLENVKATLSPQVKKTTQKPVQPQFVQLTDFQATKTKNFRRSARLKSGTYYLVFSDPTMGILSASSTDIQIQAKLEP